MVAYTQLIDREQAAVDLSAAALLGSRKPSHTQDQVAVARYACGRE